MGRETMSGMGQDHLLRGGGNRLDTEVGYGLPIGTRLVATPRVGLRTSEYGRDYRVGYGMEVLEQGGFNLQLGFDAERREVRCSICETTPPERNSACWDSRPSSGSRSRKRCTTRH